MNCPRNEMKRGLTGTLNFSLSLSLSLSLIITIQFNDFVSWAYTNAFQRAGCSILFPVSTSAINWTDPNPKVNTYFLCYIKASVPLRGDCNCVQVMSWERATLCLLVYVPFQHSLEGKYVQQIAFG